MDDAELLNRLMDGSADPDWEKHEQELVDRARAGNTLCRRLAFRMLWSAWERGCLSTPDFVTRTELIAAPNAAKGDEESTCRLAGAWALSACDMREAGKSEEAHRLEVAAMVMVGTLANNGSDLAVAEFNEMRRGMPAEVVAEAEAELWCDGLSIEPQPEPEVLQADARLEAQARFWGWSDDEEPTIQ